MDVNQDNMIPSTAGATFLKSCTHTSFLGATVSRITLVALPISRTLGIRCLCIYQSVTLFIFFVLIKPRKGFIASGLVRTILDSRAPTTPPKQLIPISSNTYNNSQRIHFCKSRLSSSVCASSSRPWSKTCAVSYFSLHWKRNKDNKSKNIKRNLLNYWRTAKKWPNLRERVERYVPL